MRGSGTYAAAALIVFGASACGAKSGLSVDGSGGDDAGARADAIVPGTDGGGALDAAIVPPPCRGPFGPIAGPYTVAVTEDDAAFDADLVSTPDGMLATWRVSFDGLDPPPTNVFSSVLDPDGRPRGEPRPMLERPVTNGPRSAPAGSGRWVLGYCGRYGAEDHATSAFVDARGERIRADTRREPSARWCSGMTPDVAWTGDVHLFGWMNGDGPGPTYVVVDAFDDTGRSVRTETLHDAGDGSAPPRFALGHGRVAVVAGVRPELRRSRLLVQVLDVGGTPASAPVLLDPPGEGSWSDAHVVTVAGGWVVVAANRFDPGLWVARFDRAGRPTTPVGVVEGLPARYTDIDVVARRPGELVVAGNEDGEGAAFGGIVILLSETGELLDAWRPGPDEEQWLGWPALLVRDGRVFALYTSPSETRPYELRLLELGCAPEG